jgi:hypothetical protein
VPIVLHAAYDFPVLLAPQLKAVKMAILADWLIVFIASAVFAGYLCNRVFPAAAAADTLRGPDRYAVLSPHRVICAGVGLIAAGTLLALCIFLLIGGRGIWWGAVVLAVSIGMGADLIRTGFQCKQEDRATTGPAGSMTPFKQPA